VAHQAVHLRAPQKWRGMLKGKIIGIDATTLDANAAKVAYFQLN
jgi:hypothetical protein